MPQESTAQPPHAATTPATTGPNVPPNQSQAPIPPTANQNFPQGPPNQEFYNRQDQVSALRFFSFMKFSKKNYVRQIDPNSELARELIGSTSMTNRKHQAQMNVC